MFFLQFSQVNIDEPMFQPYPSEVTFQNFEPYKVYEVPLILRNNDKVKINHQKYNYYYNSNLAFYFRCLYLRM